MIGIFADFKINTNWFAVLIEVETYFASVKSDRTIIDSFFSKNFSQSIQSKNFFCQITISSFYSFLRFFVAESSIGVNYGSSKPFFDHFCLIIKFKNGRKRIFIFIRT